MLTGLAAMAAGCASAAPRASDGAADALVQRFLDASGLADCSITVMRGEQALYTRYRGGYGPGTLVPIASASKWMVGATIMTLVDDGLLSLQAPIGDYVPGLPEAYAALRLDQLMSFTAGLPGLREFIELRQPADISLTESAQRAARTPLANPPGAQFDYGGPNLQFVGAAAEQVTGKTWSLLFAERLAGPLGMRATLWGRVRQAPDPKAPVANPVLQGGAWTTLPDHAAFLTMIAQDGVLQGRRVLSSAAVLAMDTVMTTGVRKGMSLPGNVAGQGEYMIAHWCERLEGARCTLSSSPGAFGAYPWIDRRANLHGVLLVQDQRPRIAAAEFALRDGLTELFQ
ncbi:serine hydrolase [Caulobacter sp. UNC358MFTsu5.1]|uniref:serine hydrolase domain-containing protein n=1 Tax=Caulobacter sp. UNC358MFTsu5.1 TaxID=1449049 RepID=UPI0004A7372B|nr:serine hydrolase domain-containing protein [Caulobacter sp. UNC358MFTsu5.1]